ncbi:hypothetical protein [Vibrio alginolyticus]|uniref:hypothetical protein n=1 Tax=Vibrio alginolyticus TaxID=663 RepID=UPI003754A03E
MKKSIVLKGIVTSNQVVGAFDIGIEIDDCDDIKAYGNDINIFSCSKCYETSVWSKSALVTAGLNMKNAVEAKVEWF